MAARAIDALELSAFGSPVDLFATVTGGKETEWIQIVAATASATVTVTTSGSGANSRTYNVAQGDTLNLQVRSIQSVVNVTKIRVGWGAF